MTNAGHRSLVPREHGAYAMFFVPMLTALIVSEPVPRIYLLAAATIAVFFAYEPLLVVFGLRGARPARDEGSRAWARIALLSLGALILGAFALYKAPAPLLWALLVPAIPSLATAALFPLKMATGRVGELLGAIALSSISVPLVVAGGQSPVTAAVMACVWLPGYASLILAVRAVLDQRLRFPLSPGRWAAAGITVLLWLLVAAAWWIGPLPVVALLALTPLCASALVLLAVFPSPRKVAAMGALALAGSLVTGAVLVALL